MSDSIYCRSALIYSNFCIRWKVSWLIWSVLVMWTSLFACWALFHNTRYWNVRNTRHAFALAYEQFFCSFVPVTFCGVARFIHGNSTNCQRDPHTPMSFEWSSSINAFYGFWQIICALLSLLLFRACVCVSSLPALFFCCYATNIQWTFFLLNNKKFRYIFGSHFKCNSILNIIICHNFEWFVNTTELESQLIEMKRQKKHITLWAHIRFRLYCVCDFSATLFISDNFNAFSFI